MKKRGGDTSRRMNKEPYPEKIKKRNGRTVKFDPEKITKAIFAAAKAAGGKDRERAEQLTERVVQMIKKKYGHETPSVEGVQDLVEVALIEAGHARTAKAYILYREQHKKIRETQHALLNVQETLQGYLGKSDWRVYENSNEAFSFSGLLLYTAEEVLRSYILTQIYPLTISESHKKGYIHIHDLGHGIIGYCAGWSMKNLLVMGFGGVANKVDCKPAKHLNTLVHQVVNFIGCLQMEFAGAQAFSSIDTFMAPFVKLDNLDYKEVKQCMQQLVFSLNIPSRWGSQFPFSNVTFDWVVPDDLKDDPAIVGGKEQKFTYGDCQKEMDIINKAFLEVMLEGDAKGSVFTFPIPTYNITNDFDWDNENVNLLFDLTAKYGLPYFQNYVGSELDPSSVRAMCCRLNLNQSEIMNRPGNIWAPGDSTGSVGVVTMNLNRIGYEATTEEAFFEKLRYFMELAKESLEIKREVVNKNMEKGLMPFTKRYLGTFDNHFSTIGLCGMHECCMNFLGAGIETSEGQAFTIKVLKFMREQTRQFQIETSHLFNLEATPAEGTSYRLARLDKEMYPEIYTAGEDEPYLTNSTQLPVDYTEDVIAALKHQNEIQPLYTGGTIFHTFLGERMQNGELCKQLVKKIAENTRLPYFSITPTFTICRDHGYIKGEHFECPTCKGPTEVYSRIVGYYRPVQNWNVGKKEEFKDRQTYNQDLAVTTPFAKKIPSIPYP